MHFENDVDISSEVDLLTTPIRYPHTQVVDFEDDVDMEANLPTIQARERIRELQAKVA